MIVCPCYHIYIKALFVHNHRTWWEKPFLQLHYAKWILRVTWLDIMELTGHVTGILYFPIFHLSSCTEAAMLTLWAWYTHGKVADDNDEWKRLTAVTRGIREILRVKMQHISIVTLSLRVILEWFSSNRIYLNEITQTTRDSSCFYTNEMENVHHKFWELFLHNKN